MPLGSPIMSLLGRSGVCHQIQGGQGPGTRVIVRFIASASPRSHAVRENLIPSNPADRARPPRDDRDREMVAWTADQTRAFLDRAGDDRLQALWLLAITTGMRRGELLGLKWSDVDLDGGRLSIRRALISVNYQIQESPPKTAKSRREISLDPGTVAALRAWRKIQSEEKLRWGPAWSDNDWVFTKESGEALHPDRVSKLFLRLVAQAGLRRIPFHSLRHGWATLALEAGVPAKVVQERLGHSTITTTLDIYSHMVKKLDEEAAETVARMIGVADGR